MNMKKKNLLLVMLLTLVLIMSTGFSAQAAVSWPSFNSSKPIKVYTISTGNNTIAYSNSNLKSKVGTIYASDELYVSYIGKNSSGRWYCQLTYPTSKGRKQGFVPLSVITNATTLSEKNTARAGITTYRRASSSVKYGSISKGDTVYKLTTSGSYTQVLYNIGSAGNPSGWKMAWITTANYSNYVKTVAFNNPQGWLDSVTSTINGKITVTGWAFDRDSLSSKLSIHVYVGGPAGSGAPCYCITANTSRADVNRVYPGVGGYHGFNKTIKVSKTGTQTVYVYAINVGGGTNVCIGSKTVTIKGNDTNTGVLTSPVPSGCKFSKKTSDNGWYGYHDINRNVSTATPVYAIADGTVTYKQAYRTYNGVKYLTSYGNYIQFKSSNGEYTAKYCHLSRFEGVSQYISSSRTKQVSGSTGTYTITTKSVKKGQIIGYIGTTGNSSGLHLHFELFKNGSRIDPTTVFSGLV